MVFYDKKGNAVVYTDNDKLGDDRLWNYDGKAVGYIKGKRIFTYDGKFCGWLIDGWITDKKGDCVMFSFHAKGGPLKPLTKIAPIKGLKKLTPMKSFEEFSGVCPIKSLSWSNVSAEDFF